MKRSNSNERSKSEKTGFTFVEIIVVVAVIGLIGAIALPSFMTARQESHAKTCTLILEAIAGAKVQTAFAHNIREDQTPTDAQLLEYLTDSGVFIPIEGSTRLCPAGGTYTVHAISTNPTCSLGAGPRIHRME